MVQREEYVHFLLHLLTPKIKLGNGFSLPEQRERLETFCKFKGYEIVDYYI